MYLNEIGLIADQCWAAIPKHFNNVSLGEFVIMPNHTHGIIIIEPPAAIVVEARHALPLQPSALPLQYQQYQQQHFRYRNPGKNTVSTMVGSFKSAVSRLSRPVNKNFGWQTRFHDHVIRSHADQQRIAAYILNNPAKWRGDRFHR